jgi:hypothetical protein
LLGVTATLLLAALSSQQACAQAPGPTGSLNDTGQTQCYNAADLAGVCNAATTGDAGVRPRQDGRFGRDVASPTKVGGGAAGFDFTRVCMNGDLAGSGSCATNPTAAVDQSLPNSTDWACTKDNVTNLIWSLEPGSGDWTTYASPALPAAHNNANSGLGRCGFNTGWRLPTRRELLNIVLNDGSHPAIDANYFPATQSSWYWTGDTYAPNPSNAWVVRFYDGDTGPVNKTYSFYVRLVRSGQSNLSF